MRRQLGELPASSVVVFFMYTSRLNPTKSKGTTHLDLLVSIDTRKKLEIIICETLYACLHNLEEIRLYNLRKKQNCRYIYIQAGPTIFFILFSFFGILFNTKIGNLIKSLHF